MSLQIQVSARAERHLKQAFEWYEDKRVGLGDEFTAAVEETLKVVADNPFAFQIQHRDVRRALTRRFPFGVFFRVRTDRIVVVSVFHSSRNPAEWNR